MANVCFFLSRGYWIVPKHCFFIAYTVEGDVRKRQIEHATHLQWSNHDEFDMVVASCVIRSRRMALVEMTINLVQKTKLAIKTYKTSACLALQPINLLRLVAMKAKDTSDLNVRWYGDIRRIGLRRQLSMLG